MTVVCKLYQYLRNGSKQALSLKDMISSKQGIKFFEDPKCLVSRMT